MREKRTAYYAQRLRDALNEGPRQMSVRALAREMGSRYAELRGTSYGGIRQYAEGKVRNPRVELLEAFADVLHVRTEWLAFGQGRMTQAQEDARIAAERQAEDANRTIHPAESGGPWEHRHFLEILEPAFGADPPPLVIATLAHVWSRLGVTHAAADEVQEPREALRVLAEAVLAPLEAIGLRWEEDLNERARIDYVVSVAPAIGRAWEDEVQDRWKRSPRPRKG